MQIRSVECDMIWLGTHYENPRFILTPFTSCEIFTRTPLMASHSCASIFLTGMVLLRKFPTCPFD